MELVFPPICILSIPFKLILFLLTMACDKKTTVFLKASPDM